MDKEKFDYLMRWLGLYSKWKHMLEAGADAYKRTDGQMLNGVRNEMKWCLSDLKTAGYTLEQLEEEAVNAGYEIPDFIKELPPVMDEAYMRDADSIRAEAEKAWSVYTESGEYKYIKENLCNLSRGADAEILGRLVKEIDFVERLELAIERNYLPEMKRYSDTAQYTARLNRAHELLAMRIDYIQPFHDETFETETIKTE